MSSLQLPSTGATNWGSGLNSYIRHLENRVQALEKSYGDMTISDVVENVAGACPGVISHFNCEKNGSTIKFSGTIYYAGDIRKVIEIKSDDPITYSINETTHKTSNKSYFVYLNYNSSASTTIERERVEISLSCDLNLSFNSILIGLYYNGDFVPYYYWHLKTIMQHHYELLNPYNTLDENAVSIYVTNGTIDITKTNGVSINSSKCNVYCGGLGYTNETIDTTIQSETKPYELTIKSAKPHFLLDSSVGDEILTTITSSVPSANDSGEGNYYRILLDIFGNIFVQKATADASFKVDKNYSEQTLLNLRFGRQFFKLNTSKTDYDYSLQANLFMEVGRFGYNSLATGSFSSGTSGVSIDSICYTHSIRDGVGGQPFMNIWDVADGYLYLDKLKFATNESTESAAFTINYNGGLQEVSINKNAKDFDSIDISKFYLYTCVTESDCFKTLTFLKSVKSVVLKCNNVSRTITGSGSATLYGGFTCEWYTLTNILTINFVVPNPVSDIMKQCTIESIEFGNTMLDIDSSCMLSTRFLWTQTDAQDEVIQLKNNEASLILPTRTYEPLLLKSSAIKLQTKDGTDILSHSSSEGGRLSLATSDSASSYGSLDFFVTSPSTGTTKTSIVHKHGKTTPFVTSFIEHTYSSTKNELTFNATNSTFNTSELTFNGTVYMKDGEQILFTSDRRRKDNFKNIEENYLSIVNQVPVLEYTYKNSDKKQVGIIAQDLEQVMTNNIDSFVTIQETADLKDKRSLNENKLIYILWKALQEESKLRNKLEQRLIDLENKL